MIGAAFGLGFILGPALGGLLGDANPRLPFWVAGGMSLANALYGFIVLPESLSPDTISRLEIPSRPMIPRWNAKSDPVSGWLL